MHAELQAKLFLVLDVPTCVFRCEFVLSDSVIQKKKNYKFSKRFLAANWKKLLLKC